MPQEEPPKTEIGELKPEPEVTDLPDSETPEAEDDEPTESPDAETRHIDPSEESPELDTPEDPEDPEPADNEPAMAVAVQSPSLPAPEPAAVAVDAAPARAPVEHAPVAQPAAILASVEPPEHSLVAPSGKPPLSDGDVERDMSRRSRKSFLMGAVAVAATAGGLYYLNDKAEDNNGVPWPLRKVLKTNEKVAETIFRPTRVIPELPVARVTLPARENGDLGLSQDVDVSQWSLQFQPTRQGKTGDNDWDTFSLSDIKALPRRDMVTELHCIEGWTIVQHWVGARFSDFVDAHTMYSDHSKLPAFVGIMTPDGEYYVGLDMESVMHPQTLLCYEQNGAPLEQEHGAPLRLVIPVKYGVKNIKRIGSITFSNTRPADYWAEQGYDWYCGF